MKPGVNSVSLEPGIGNRESRIGKARTKAVTPAPLQARERVFFRFPIPHSLFPAAPAPPRYNWRMNAATPNAWMPQPLRKLAGRALETALNHTLSLDPQTQQRLTALNGRSVQLHLRGPELALAITVDQAHLKVGPPR